MGFELLGSPVSAAGKVIKNRIVVPPMADFGMTGPDGMVNERHIARYGSYADGGAGLVIIEACAVSRMKEPRNTIGIFDDRCIPGLSCLAEASKRNGARALVQLINTGRDAMEGQSIDEISHERFMEYKRDFVSAAVRCRKAGFDGIELHAAYGMYLNEIIETGRRTDGYGGSLDGRVRILTELISEIKEACGDGFITTARIGSRDMGELTEITGRAEEAGIDLLDICSGMERYTGVPENFGFDAKVYAASLVKKQAGVPVICVGNIFDGETAERILELGLADMTAVGRGHLCDPAWAGKVLAGKRPFKCLRCRRCLWYIDGRRCPGRMIGEREEKKA